MSLLWSGFVGCSPIAGSARVQTLRLTLPEHHHVRPGVAAMAAVLLENVQTLKSYLTVTIRVCLHRLPCPNDENSHTLEFEHGCTHPAPAALAALHQLQPGYWLDVMCQNLPSPPSHQASSATTTDTRPRFDNAVSIQVLLHRLLCHCLWCKLPEPSDWPCLSVNASIQLWLHRMPFPSCSPSGGQKPCIKKPPFNPPPHLASSVVLNRHTPALPDTFY